MNIDELVAIDARAHAGASTRILPDAAEAEALEARGMDARGITDEELAESAHGHSGVAADFPDLQIVMAHPGVPWQGEQLSVALHKPNVWIDLSGWSRKSFEPKLVSPAA